MKFKQQQEEQSNVEEQQKAGMSKNLYDGFIDLIQFEYDKIALACSAKYYFYDNGIADYEKFFANIYNACIKHRDCLIKFLRTNLEKIPEFRNPAIDCDFKDSLEPFKLLSEKEDIYIEKLSNLLDIAFSDKNWIVFAYLLEKIHEIDHICCRALSAVENKSNVLDLCEQHTMEK